MPITRRRILSAGSMAGVLVALPQSSPFAIAAEPITVANAAGVINMTMRQCMLDLKYMEAFDLSPKFMDIADGSKIVAGLVGGDVDVSTMSGFGQIFPAIEKGAPLKVLGGAALLPSLAVFSSKSDIHTIQDLKGRTVGIGSPGALLHQLMVALLIKEGMNLADIVFVNVGSSADVFRAVSRGVVDAGPGEVGLLDEPDRYHVHGVTGGNMSVRLTEYTYQGAWTSDKEISGERDRLVRTLAAFAKLYRYVQSPDAQDAFLKAHRTVVPNAEPAERTSLWNYIQRYRPFAENLVIGRDRIDYIQNLNVSLKVQKSVLPLEKVADMSLARDALKLLA